MKDSEMQIFSGGVLGLVLLGMLTRTLNAAAQSA